MKQCKILCKQGETEKHTSLKYADRSYDTWKLVLFLFRNKEEVKQMKEFTYVITDEVGLHARPAGLLAKEAKKYQSTITLHANGKDAVASKLMAVMGMGVKKDDTVQVCIEGDDEDIAAQELEQFFNENL